MSCFHIQHLTMRSRFDLFKKRYVSLNTLFINKMKKKYNHVFYCHPFGTTCTQILNFRGIKKFHKVKGRIFLITSIFFSSHYNPAGPHNVYKMRSFPHFPSVPFKQWATSPQKAMRKYFRLWINLTHTALQ